MPKQVLATTRIRGEGEENWVSGELYTPHRSPQIYDQGDFSHRTDLEWFRTMVNRVRKALQDCFPERYRFLQIGIQRIEVHRKLKFRTKGILTSEVDRLACATMREPRVLFITPAGTESPVQCFEEVAHSMSVILPLDQATHRIPEFASETHMKMMMKAWNRKGWPRPTTHPFPVRCEFDIHTAVQRTFSDEELARSGFLDSVKRTKAVVENACSRCRERHAKGNCPCNPYEPMSRRERP